MAADLEMVTLLFYPSNWKDIAIIIMVEGALFSHSLPC
jgi:hypothetical protein